MTTHSVRPTIRETSAFVRNNGLRPLIVTVHHGLLMLRPKGTRQVETCDLAGVWQGLVKARVFKERLEKKRSKPAKTRTTRR